MVRLNRTQLEPKQIDKLLLQLAKVLAPEEFSQANLVLIEILGKEEQVMIAKRLTVVILLLEGLSKYKISRELKLSESTVASISQKINNGEFDTVLKILERNKKDYFSVLETIDNILHLGGVLPHYNGLDRYKYL